MKRIPLIAIALAFALHGAEGKSAGGARIAALDLSQENAPLFIVQKLAPTVWEYPQETIAKVCDEGWGTAFLRASDPRRPHVTIQAYWLVRAQTEAGVRRVFGDVSGHLQRYGLRVVIEPGEPKVVRTLRAGSEKVPVYGVDLSATTRKGRKRRVFVYAFAANGWVASLVVAHVGEARYSSEFLDGFQLSKKLPTGSSTRRAQFSSGVDYRVSLKLPSKPALARTYEGKQGRGLAVWRSPKTGDHLRIATAKSIGDFQRMVEAWAKRNADALKTAETKELKVKRGDCLVVSPANAKETVALFQQNGVFVVITIEATKYGDEHRAAAKKRHGRFVKSLVRGVDCWLLN